MSEFETDDRRDYDDDRYDEKENRASTNGARDSTGENARYQRGRSHSPMNDVRDSNGDNDRYQRERSRSPMEDVRESNGENTRYQRDRSRSPMNGARDVGIDSRARSASPGDSNHAPPSKDDDAGAHKNPGTNLFVRNIDEKWTEVQLEKMFQQHGDVVTECSIMMDPRTGVSRCFGFVRMEDADQANHILELFKSPEIAGRIVVELARRDTPREKTPGRYRGRLPGRGDRPSRGRFDGRPRDDYRRDGFDYSYHRSSRYDQGNRFSRALCYRDGPRDYPPRDPHRDRYQDRYRGAPYQGGGRRDDYEQRDSYMGSGRRDDYDRMGSDRNGGDRGGPRNGDHRLYDNSGYSR